MDGDLFEFIRMGMFVDGETLQPPSVEEDAAAPSLEWLTEEQQEFCLRNFALIRTEYNMVQPREVKHRISLISSFSQSFVDDIYHKLYKMIDYRRHPVVLGYSLVLLVENNSTGSVSYEISNAMHCFYFTHILNKPSFALFKRRFEYVFNRAPSNRFQDISGKSRLKNMIDKHRPVFKSEMVEVHLRRAFRDKRVVMPIGINIYIRNFRREQRLPILVGRRGLRLIDTRNTDAGYDSN